MNRFLFRHNFDIPGPHDKWFDKEGWLMFFIRLALLLGLFGRQILIRDERYFRRLTLSRFDIYGGFNKVE